ncbi:hypothetical protein J3R82DRAFT_5922 [Butyriboletus roseoflavus]|nr:hypothetical protein J3R82DRAFT_5922 [Butyriboletus roseoflavus]
MAVTEGKKKKPPTFRYLPKSRGEYVSKSAFDDEADLISAKRLKKSWVEDHKIRSKWKAQKKKEGLTDRIVEGASNHRHDESKIDSESDRSQNRPGKSPTPPHDKQSLRDLRRIAHSSKPLRTQKVDSSHPKRAPRHSDNDRGEKATVGRETGQPNMKLRMNVLLEKIKRDFS